MKPGLSTCLKSLFEQGASSGTAAAKVLGEGVLPFPKLAPRTAAFRIDVQTRSADRTLTGDVDIVLLGRGRIDVVLLFVWPYGQLAYQPARVVARRMK